MGKAKMQGFISAPKPFHRASLWSSSPRCRRLIPTKRIRIKITEGGSIRSDGEPSKSSTEEEEESEDEANDSETEEEEESIVLSSSSSDGPKKGKRKAKTSSTPSGTPKTMDGSLLASPDTSSGWKRRSRRLSMGQVPCLKEISSDEDIVSQNEENKYIFSTKTSNVTNGESAPKQNHDKSKMKSTKPNQKTSISARHGGAYAKPDRPPTVQLQPFVPVRRTWYKTEMDASCTVCGDGDEVDENVMLFCEGFGCTVVVHQLCYGIKEVPEGTWLCDACSLWKNPGCANCVVCPIVGGALRRVTNLGKVQVAPSLALQKDLMAHTACALWTPEIVLRDPSSMDMIDLSELSADRMQLKCSICKQRGGAVFECSYGACRTAFHVLCGRLDNREQGFRWTDGKPLAFCDAHSEPRFAARRQALIEGKVEQFHGDEDGSESSSAGPSDAPLTAYELDRLKRMEEIEATKSKIFT